MLVVHTLFRYYFLFYAVVVILIPVTFTVLNFVGILKDLNSSSLGDGKKMMESNKGAIVSLEIMLTYMIYLCCSILFQNSK